MNHKINVLNHVRNMNINNLCIDACPNGTLINENLCEDNKCLLNRQNFLECLGNTPEGYYFDSNDQIYKKCFPDCKFCNGPGDKTNNNCIEYKAIKTTNLDISISEEINYSNYVEFLSLSENENKYQILLLILMKEIMIYIKHFKKLFGIIH